MTHVKKDLWPTAFQEGKQLADVVLHLNRSLKKFTKVKPDEIPTDRELALAACVQIFWAYKAEQEAGHAARRIALEKCLTFLQTFHDEDLEPRRLAKGLKKILARTEGEGFLALWEKVQLWLSVATQPAYWEQFESDPSTVVRELVKDLERVAQQGEDSGQEINSTEAGSSTPNGEERTEGDPRQADGAAEAGAQLRECEPEPGENGSAGAVREGREGLETAPSGVQEQDQEPAGSGR